MLDARKIDRLYYGRALRWLMIGCLYLVSVVISLWALFDVSADTFGTKDAIESMRWHGLFFFVVAIGLFVGVGWLVRFPLPIWRYRAFMKLLRAFWLVGLGGGCLATLSDFMVALVIFLVPEMRPLKIIGR